MIHYDTNNTTIFYIDQNGKKISRNPLDGEEYSRLDLIMQDQIVASQENFTVLDKYMNSLRLAQESVSAGRQPEVIPVKPLMRTVTDQGISTMGPFDPPLPDLIPLNVAPITQPSTPPDKTAAMYNMILAIYRKTFPNG